jgi:hypothetical protein
VGAGFALFQEVRLRACRTAGPTGTAQERPRRAMPRGVAVHRAGGLLPGMPAALAAAAAAAAAAASSSKPFGRVRRRRRWAAPVGGKAFLTGCLGRL